MLSLDFNFVLEMINLVVLFLLLRKFLIRPLTDIMEKRKAMIEEGLQNASDQKAQALEMKEKYDLEIFLEPGEAVALNAGVLLTKVEEIVENSIQIAILDTSAACHMPDVLEMPYRPPLQDGYEAEEKEYTYRLAGPTCLAGDVIGDYSFEEPLKRGDTLTFEDMAIYTMVKNNTFNGMRLPAIVLEDKDGECRVVRQFEYEDFKMRL